MKQDVGIKNLAKNYLEVYYYGNTGKSSPS